MTRQQRANNNFHHTESPFGNFLPFFFLKPSINMWLYLDVCDEPVHKGESLQGKMKCNHVKGTVGCGNYGRGGDLLSPLTVTNTNAHNDDTSGRNYPWNSLIVVLELNLNYSQISHRFSKKILSDPNQEARQGGHGDQTQYFLFPHQIPHRICSLSLSGDHEPNLIWKAATTECQQLKRNQPGISHFEFQNHKESLNWQKDAHKFNLKVSVHRLDQTSNEPRVFFSLPWASTRPECLTLPCIS